MKRIFIFGMAVLTFAFSNKLYSQAVCFNLPTTTVYSINPQSIISNDINADGNMDLITVEPAAYKVTLHLGNGSGTFSPTANFFTGALPFFATVNDFNSDGKKDIATCNLSNMSILTATAPGSFSTAVNYSTTSNPIGIVSGDFSGDSKPDIAIAFQGTPAIAVFINNGTGLFNPSTSYTLSNNAWSICSKDFNLDSKQDLAVFVPPNIISVFIAGTSGAFNPSINYTVNTTNKIISEDFNGDGNFDLALSQASSSCIAIMNGTGIGTFSAPVTYTVGTTPVYLTAGDFNLDGKLDLATVNSATNANISILAGSGTGSFIKIATYSISSQPDDITSGDYNNDGRKDLATCKYTNKDYTVLLNCLGVGIVEFSEKNNVLVYPNPSDGNYFINLTVDSEIEVYDILGKIVKKETLRNGLSNLVIVDQTSGFYFLKILDLVSREKHIVKLIKE